MTTAASPQFKRGFKTWSETQAATFRDDLGLQEIDPLCAFKLAEHLDIHLLDIRTIPAMPLSRVAHLLNVDPSSWSGVTFACDDRTFVIPNPNHSPGRQQSDLMHEIAHVVCQHPPIPIVAAPCIPFALRGYDGRSEDEARWLGACLQLPRPALSWALRTGMDNDAIADFFGASKQLVRYRRQVTGIDRQFAYTGAKIA